MSPQLGKGEVTPVSPDGEESPQGARSAGTAEADSSAPAPAPPDTTDLVINELLAERGDIQTTLDEPPGVGGEARSDPSLPPDDSEMVEVEDERARWMDKLLDEFIEKHQGEWKTGDLIVLSERLSRAGYRYQDIAALNARLQRKKEAFHENADCHLSKLLQNGILRKFVDEHRGAWEEKELSELEKQIKSAGLWPVKQSSLTSALEELRGPWKAKMATNLKRLLNDGLLKEYISSRRSGWTKEGWSDLMTQLDEKGYSPIDEASLAMALKNELALRARENLERLQKDGILSKFIASHKGRWSREDLHDLLRRIENEGYAPIVNLLAALEAERRKWKGQSDAAS